MSVRLDDTQLAVVNSNDQYLQVIGYPGSGKTLVMAHHAARLVADGADPASIVALTFTNSAQLTLRAGIERALGENYGNPAEAQELAAAIRIHTFHSFSCELVAEYGDAIGLDKKAEMFDFLDSHNLQYNPLSRKAPSGPEVQSFWKKYHTFDFDSAIRYATEIVDTAATSTANISVASPLRVAHVLLDEFQDCTTLQWGLIKAIIRGDPSAHLVVCGDPNQEIFQFQEDHFENAFDRMKQELPTREMELLYNYRSTPEIVTATQEILNMCTGASPQIKAVKPPGPEPEMFECALPTQEVEGIARLIQSSNFRLRDIAILVRTQAGIQYFSTMLDKLGVPNYSVFSVRGLGVKKLPSVALTLLKWAHDPRDVYLMQLLYNRYCKFIRLSAFSGLKLRLDRPSSLTTDLIELNPRLYDRPFLREWLPMLRHRLGASKTPEEIGKVLREAMVEWGPKSGLRLHVTDTDRTDWQNFMKYFETVAGSLGTEIPAEHTIEHGSALLAVLHRLYHPDADEAADKVQISTIHAAKSREWPVVILPSLPHTMWKDKPVDAHRLQYVAASRAQQQLYFFNTGAVEPGSRNSFVPVRPTAPLLSAAQAVKLYPLVFKPIKFI